ncbi:hypothetical protein ACSDQ9_11855 [Aestuariimicrobium soli]|uniref:hypothetical protein n=1 Tax=Aestuariimicrobium soli TaxID=2035834 RepID=UPI003EB6E240
MTLAAAIVITLAVVLGCAVAAMVAFGLRRNAVADEGVRGQFADLGRHLNGDAEVPEKFAQLVARTSN